MDSQTLRATIRSKLTRGALPREKCQVTWFGAGSGQQCVACERAITRVEIECECEHGTQTIRFHQACFAVWDDERRQGEPGAVSR